MLTRYVISHLLYQYKKVIPVAIISALILALSLVTFLISEQAKVLALRPLKQLNSEIILQLNSETKAAANLMTTGLIEPFNLTTFSKEAVSNIVNQVDGVAQVSSALLLWKLGPSGTSIFAGIDLSDPNTGMRNINNLLVKPDVTFSSNSALEIILERHFATLMGYKIGDSYELSNTTLTIINFVDFQEESNINSATGFLPYTTATSLSGLDAGVVNQLFLTLNDSSNLAAISKAISEQLPTIQVITKDSMYKNLSAYSQFIFNAGDWSITVLVPIALGLIYWIIRLYQKENRIYIKTLRLIGWPRRYTLQWQISDVAIILCTALIFAVGIALSTQSLFTAGLDQSIVINTGLKL